MMSLMSLPESYEVLVTSLESLESIDPNKLTWEIVATRLLNEELMRREKVGLSQSSTETALILAQKKFESKGSRDKTKDVCNYCKELDHWARECKKGNADWKKKSEQSNNVSEASDEGKNGEAFMSALSVSSGSTT